MEQQSLYQVILNKTTLPTITGAVSRTGLDMVVYAMKTDSVTGYTAGGTINWWSLFSEEEQKGFAMTTYACPTRRGTNQMLFTGTITGEDCPGPLGDYAAVCLVNSSTNSHYWHDHLLINASTTDERKHFESHQGPLRVAIIENVIPTDDGPNDFGQGRPRDTFARWQDGLSNQLVIGEKHIPNSRLGISKLGATSSDTAPFVADHTYITSGRWAAGAARNIYPSNAKLSSANDFSDTMVDPVKPTSGTYRSGGYGFGSWHPGICYFLLGDGSVKSFSNTTHPENVLVTLANVYDGNVVSLP
jgi:hypothetical protein